MPCQCRDFLWSVDPAQNALVFLDLGGPEKLSSTSWHQRAIHEGWPVGEVRRLHRNCLHASSFRLYRDRLTARFRRFRLEPGIVSRCQGWRPQVFLHGAVPERASRKSPVRIVLRFHPARSRIGKRLGKLISSWSPSVVGLRYDCNEALSLQIAYRNHGPALRVLARKCVSV